MKNLFGEEGGGVVMAQQQSERPRHQRGLLEHRQFRVAVEQDLIGGRGRIYSHPMTWSNARDVAIGWERAGCRVQVLMLGEDVRR